MEDLKSLNSKVLNDASIEELEERLELSCWTDCSISSYGAPLCGNPYDFCGGNQFLSTNCDWRYGFE